MEFGIMSKIYSKRMAGAGGETILCEGKARRNQFTAWASDEWNGIDLGQIENEKVLVRTFYTTMHLKFISIFYFSDLQKISQENLLLFFKVNSKTERLVIDDIFSSTFHPAIYPAT